MSIKREDLKMQNMFWLAKIKRFTEVKTTVERKETLLSDKRQKWKANSSQISHHLLNTCYVSGTMLSMLYIIKDL